MKKSKQGFRHELKFLITYREKTEIVQKLRCIMQMDDHAGASGYMIRSLYFDDIWESAYQEKMAGTGSRKKYRIRCYDGNSQVIKLERKRKEGQYIQKTAESLTEEEFYKILSGDVEFLQKSNQELQQEFYREIKYNQMKPKVIVDYEREPYVYPYGDVRITFDTHIRSAISDYDIFNMEIPTLETLPQEQLIMEVKFTEYLPEIIRAILPTERTVHTAASKYVMCVDKQREFCRR